MMILGAYVEISSLRQVVDRLQTLPEEFRPIFFGSNEKKPPASQKMGSRAKYDQFLRTNGTGHFLFGERCRFDITPRFLPQYATVFMDPMNEGFGDAGAVAACCGLAGPGTEFVFAAEVGEYHHRNRYSARLGESKVEAWVGRDLQRYVPGLYWLTGFGSRAAGMAGFDDGRLPAGAIYEEVVPGWSSLRMQGTATSWREWAAELDALCAQNPGTFSLERLRPAFERHENYGALLAELAKWR